MARKLKTLRTLALCFAASFVIVACGSEEDPSLNVEGEDVSLEDTVSADSIVKPPPPPVLANNFNERFGIDSFRFSTLEPVLDEYLQAGEDKRTEMRAAIGDTASLQLLAYAYHSSVQAVQFDSEQSLLYGLAALSLEDARYNFKENLTGFSLLHTSAKFMDKNPELLFTQISALSTAEFGKMIDDFLARDDARKASNTFGYTYISSQEEGNFDYIYKSFEIRSDAYEPES